MREKINKDTMNADNKKAVVESISKTFLFNIKLIKLGLIWVQFLAESMPQTEVNGINNENCFSMFQFEDPIHVTCILANIWSMLLAKIYQFVCNKFKIIVLAFPTHKLSSEEWGWPRCRLWWEARGKF